MKKLKYKELKIGSLYKVKCLFHGDVDELSFQLKEGDVVLIVSTLLLEEKDDDLGPSKYWQVEYIKDDRKRVFHLYPFHIEVHFEEIES